MLSLINSCAVQGMNGYRLIVEVDLSAGLSGFEIVGLPDASVRESRERVRAAVRNSGYNFPLRRITVNLAPADIRKEGPSLDLPIAIGILAASGQLAIPLEDVAFVGELSLEGSLRPIAGALAIADQLGREEGIKRLFVPRENSAEAAIINGLEVYAADTLAQAVSLLRGETIAQPVKTDPSQWLGKREGPGVDMADVRGQQAVKRALEIAAAGGHNMLMIGSPGSGKTMLARRLPTIMPQPELEESLLITKIYSVSGQLPPGQALMGERPFRSPHHSASSASIIGGGTVPKPGEVSLASGGVLFMDELPEFHRDVLEALRQPLEEQMVTVSRARGRADFPADFQLVAAMNPCPCGFFGDSRKECTCTEHMRRRYFSRLSGPLLDRIDLHVTVPRVEYQAISAARGDGDSSEVIRQRVQAAREIQSQRFHGSAIRLNSRMSRRQLENYCLMDAEAALLLKNAFHQLNMSGRAHDRILKVARTIADLSSSPNIQAVHIAEAIQYRCLDREVL